MRCRCATRNINSRSRLGCKSATKVAKSRHILNTLANFRISLIARAAKTANADYVFSTRAKSALLTAAAHMGRDESALDYLLRDIKRSHALRPVDFVRGTLINLFAVPGYALWTLLESLF